MTESNSQSKIAIIAAAENTITSFLRNHITELAREYDVTVITNTQNIFFLEPLDVNVIPVKLIRNISIIDDLMALVRLVHIFRAERFDLVFSVTPKAGLLAMLAGLIGRVPVRIHMFTGQIWVTRKGIARVFLKTIDQLLALCATHILVDSNSQLSFLSTEGVIDMQHSSVLAKGSICGVEEARFQPDNVGRKEIRSCLGVSEKELLFLFLGRLNRDKGVLDLAEAFSYLTTEGHKNIHLAYVGPDESRIVQQIMKICDSCISRVHFIDYTDKPEKYMAAADVFCLPSYREGFGTVIIEAAAVGVPAVASKIYGITDAIVDGETGLLHPPGDPVAIARLLTTLIDNPKLIHQMGKVARQRVVNDFLSEKVTTAFLSYIRISLSKHNCRK